MTHQQRWQTYPSNASTSARTPKLNMQEDDSATFVKPRHEGSAQPFTPYTYTEEVIPPPPPDLYQELPHQPKRNRGYVIAIALLAMLVVGLGSLEMYQIAGGKMLAQESSKSQGSNQSSMTSAQQTSVSQKATPIRTLTPGTIKENILLTCGVCDDPILTTISTITIDTTNQRMIWVVKLYNHSGEQQVDDFSVFNLQDLFGNAYEGTGSLNSSFILSSEQIELQNVIFSFLPRPGVPYTLITRLGVSGKSYEPIQFMF
jgi:hypothetical protein